VTAGDGAPRRRIDRPPVKGGSTMLRLAVLIWVLAGTVIAGAAVTAVLATPSLSADTFRLVPLAGIGGYLIAIPIAYAVARQVLGAAGPSRRA
jgi:hypothetical protein